MHKVLHRTDPAAAWLTDRCCLTCGYRGREMQGRRGQERLMCPRCRQDLYSRPPRSYAEMEGLAQSAPRSDEAPPVPSRRRAALLRLAGELLDAGLLIVRPDRPGKRRHAARV